MHYALRAAIFSERHRGCRTLVLECERVGARRGERVRLNEVRHGDSRGDHRHHMADLIEAVELVPPGADALTFWYKNMAAPAKLR